MPRTALRDRLSGRVVYGTKPGPKPYLSNEQGVSPAPSATVSLGLSTTVSPGPLNTVSSAVEGLSKTVIVISVPASSFHRNSDRARGSISSSPQGTNPISMKTLPRACLLTSSDVLAEMEEKEKKEKLALRKKHVERLRGK